MNYWRWMGALSYACVLASMSSVAVAQQSCAVEEQRKQATIRGRLSIEQSTVALTLPYTLYRAEPSFLMMQVTGPDPPGDWFLDSGGEKVRIRDGAKLHLTPRRNQRLTFNVVDGSGQSRCQWIPNVGTSKWDAPVIPQGFASSMKQSTESKYFKNRRFLNAGDPILLQVGGTLKSESAPYSIDGEPATVLARNASQVVLEDAHPRAGMRVIESRGYSISLAFLILDLKLLNSTTPGLTSIEIQVLGREQIDLPSLRFRRLGLMNLDPERLQILCAPNHRDSPLIDVRGKEDRLTASCRVKLLKPGPVSIDGLFMETGPGEGAAHFPLPGRTSPIPGTRLPIPWPH